MRLIASLIAVAALVLVAAVATGLLDIEFEDERTLTEIDIGEEVGDVAEDAENAAEEIENAVGEVGEELPDVETPRVEVETDEQNQ